MLVADAIIHLTSNTVAAIQLLGDSNSVYKFPSLIESKWQIPALDIHRGRNDGSIVEFWRRRLNAIIHVSPAVIPANAGTCLMTSNCS